MTIFFKALETGALRMNNFLKGIEIGKFVQAAKATERVPRTEVAAIRPRHVGQLYRPIHRHR
jgi:hypothetical protein